MFPPRPARLVARACAALGATLVVLGPSRAASAQAYDASPIETSLAFEAPCLPGAAVELRRGASLLFFLLADASRGAFERAAEIDPDCALAGWGEALALARLPTFDTSPSATARARAALARAAGAASTTPRDRRLVGATQVLFDASVPSPALRLKAFGDGMHGLAHAEPANILALGSAVLADLVRTTLPDDAPVRSARDRIAHAYPDPAAMPPEIAFLRLLVADDAADVTLAVAARLKGATTPTPFAAHAAARVFHRIGHWDDAAAAAETAQRVAGGWFEPATIAPPAWIGPVADWAIAVAAQQGRSDRITAIARSCAAAVEGAATALDETLGPRTANACVRAGVRAWFADVDWQAAAPGDDPPGAGEPMPGTLEAPVRSLSLLARGLHMARTAWPRGQPDLIAGARTVIKDLEALAVAHPALGRTIELDRLLVAMALAGAFESRDELLVYELQAGDLERVLDESRQDTPRLIGVNRLAGELHLRLHDYREAHAHFAKALARQPNDARALLGMARASARMGDAPASADAARRFLALWSGADRARAEVVETRKLVP